MATFLPIRSPNAIDQAVFVVKVSKKIGELYLTELKMLKETLVGFENFKDVKVQGVMMTPNGMTVQDNRVIGGSCNTPPHAQEHLVNSERPDWLLNITEDTIQINCLNYVSWGESIAYVDNILTKTFECLPSSEIFITGVTFQVNDSFVVQDNIDDVDYSQLFNHSKYLPENAWSVGSLWHVHSGWFDNKNSNNDLNVLNISTRKDVSETILLQVSIEHMQQFTFEPMVALAGNESAPITIFNRLHARNKSVATDLLLADIKAQIGLS